MENLLTSLQVNSVGSIAARAVIWLVLVSIFAFGASEGHRHHTIKAEAGIFVAFLILTAITIYITFGFIPTLTSK